MSITMTTNQETQWIKKEMTDEDVNGENLLESLLNEDVMSITLVGGSPSIGFCQVLHKDFNFYLDYTKEIEGGLIETKFVREGSDLK